MHFGVAIPNFGEEYCEARDIATLAREAEQTGWEAFFIADQITFNAEWRPPIVDPWVALAAAATVTDRILLGTWVTGIARRRPWKLARETVSLDRLSGGRLILGAGLGSPPDAEFGMFGEDASDRIRAEKTDEGLELLERFWSGEAVNHTGKHFRVTEAIFQPVPLQHPRIPVWVAAKWPSEAKGPFRRAARWDGFLPVRGGPEWQKPFTPDEVRAAVDRVRSFRGRSPLEVGYSGNSPAHPDEAIALAGPIAEAGATWWLETFHPWRGPISVTRERIAAGPPGR